MVNRVWHWHFGRGIVPTPGNFGKMGMPPSHPELLDWLATEFVRQGWSMKQMHRLIMTLGDLQDGFQLLRMPPIWRRTRTNVAPVEVPAAAAGGRGHSRHHPVCQRPDQPRKPAERRSSPRSPSRCGKAIRQGKWVLTKEEPSTWRRSVYSYWKRGLKYPMFEVHDQPDLNVTCEKRNITTVPTQALTLLNNEFVLLQARYFAERVAREAGDDPAKQIERSIASP